MDYSIDLRSNLNLLRMELPEPVQNALTVKPLAGEKET